MNMGPVTLYGVPVYFQASALLSYNLVLGDRGNAVLEVCTN